MKITTALLKAADTTNPNDYYDGIVESMNQYAEVYAIDNDLRIAHFLSQIAHESAFRIVEENGSYSATRMRQIFGCIGGSGNYDAARDECTKGRLREKLWTEEAKYARNPANLLAYVYAMRLGNGDEASGDGFRYRGRGMIQLTGKTNYQRFTESHNRNNPDDPRDFVADPDLVASKADRKYGIESAFYFWHARNINAIADSDDVVAVTKAVNGGLNGLDDRKARLANVRLAMNAMAA